MIFVQPDIVRVTLPEHFAYVVVKHSTESVRTFALRRYRVVTFETGLRPNARIKFEAASPPRDVCATGRGITKERITRTETKTFRDRYGHWSDENGTVDVRPYKYDFFALSTRGNRNETRRPGIVESIALGSARYLSENVRTRKRRRLTSWETLSSFSAFPRRFLRRAPIFADEKLRKCIRIIGAFQLFGQSEKRSNREHARFLAPGGFFCSRPPTQTRR